MNVTGWMWVAFLVAATASMTVAAVGVWRDHHWFDRVDAFGRRFWMWPRAAERDGDASVQLFVAVTRVSILLTMVMFGAVILTLTAGTPPIGRVELEPVAVILLFAAATALSFGICLSMWRDPRHWEELYLRQTAFLPSAVRPGGGTAWFYVRAMRLFIPIWLVAIGAGVGVRVANQF